MSNGFFIKSKKNMEIIKDGILKKGLIVRVLILHGHVDDAKKIIDNADVIISKGQGNFET